MRAGCHPDLTPARAALSRRDDAESRSAQVARRTERGHPLSDPFFDYDQDTLRDDVKRALQQDAQWLSKWPQTRLLVEGHCDERGKPEHNLARHSCWRRARSWSPSQDSRPHKETSHASRYRL